MQETGKGDCETPRAMRLVWHHYEVRDMLVTVPIDVYDFYLPYLCIIGLV